MRRLAQHILDLLYKRAWLRKQSKSQGHKTHRLRLEALEDRFLPATSVAQVLPATLTGTAFIDHNNNGVIDAGEMLLPGATISLSGKDLQGNAVKATAVTDAKGVYKFLQVPAGTYQVSISTNGSFLSGSGSAGSQGGVVNGSVVSSISIDQGQTLVGYNLAVIGLANAGLISLRQFMSTTLLVNGIPFFAQGSPISPAGSGLGYADGAPPPAILTAVGTGSLSGFVKDTGTIGIANVTIGLTGITSGGANAGLPTFFSTTTDSTGAYKFSNLAAGVYTLNVVTQPGGFRAGLPVLGSLDGYIRDNDTIAGIDVTTTAGTGYNFTEIVVTEPNGAAPAVEAHLVNDTAGAAGTVNDLLTSDPTVAGIVAGVGQVTSLTGSIDGGAAVTLQLPAATGRFLISNAFMNQMAGGTLADGQHTLHLTVIGTGGSASTNLTFTLDTAPPTAATVHLDSTSDPGQIGRPIQGTVTILGTTAPNTHVDLISGASSSIVASADTTTGEFSFAQTLPAGPNDFSVIVTDAAGNKAQTNTTFVFDRAPTGSIPNVTVTLPAANQILDLAADFTDQDTSSTLLQIHTSAGDVTIQLNDAQDPQTVANFLNYVKSGSFNNTFFHRLNKGFVLQGGGFTLAVAPTTIGTVATGPTVKNEFLAANSNLRGTLAMAKVGSDPNSATSQFFFNLANNSSNLDSQNGGFTVFASIADGFSQRIVDNLASSAKITDESTASGTALNTVQTVTLNGAPTGGTFTLSLSGTATAPIAFNASASAVQAALANLPSPVGTGTLGANVSVTGTPGKWTITFIGNLAGVNVAQLGSFSNLTGGTFPTITVAVTTPGSAANSALGELPLVNYSGSNFPTDATAANFELVTGVTILRNSEFLTYTITSNNNPAVAEATLDPVFNNRLTLRFMSQGTSLITVVATDKSNRSVSSTFTVTISTPATNQNPVIANQSFTVAHGSANGTTVGTVQASDPDGGQTLTYAIIAGNTDNTFAIDAATGKITVASNTDLNGATNPTFSLTVQVSDNGNPVQTTQASITIKTVANQAPTIANQTLSAVAGTANGTVLGTVAASGSNGQAVIYAINGGNATGAFSINPTTGQLTVANSAALTVANSPFSLTVVVTDTNHTPLSSSATVTVNVTANQAPTIANQSFGVTQSSAVGTVVGTVQAGTAGVGQILTYSIINGNTGGTFAIDPATGVITVADNTVLDTASPFALTVQVADNNNTQQSSTATITITSSPANNHPSITGQSFSVVDGSPVGTVVGTVAASDPDAGQVLTYSITSGNTGGTFQIDPNTGQITVANNTNLNLAVFPTFNLIVQVTDNGFPPLSSVANITINLSTNNLPNINNQTFAVNTGSPNGTVVGTAVANDPDPGQHLTYAITAGNTSGTFQINSTTGVISVANNAILDLAHSPFHLTVTVTDNDARPLNFSAVMTVNVVPVNVNPPTIANQTFSVVDGSPNSTVVGTVAASDPDAGQTVTYAITGGNTGNTFQINSTTGQITVANNAVLDATVNPIFALTVKVTDSGLPALNSSATVTINLTPNTPPTIASQGFSVPAASGNATVVGVVTASDPDAGQTVSYSILSGNTNNAFNINAATGQITVLDSNQVTLANSPFLLIVQVADNDRVPLTSSATVTITVT